MRRTVLVTGVAEPLGAKVAATLGEDSRFERVLGVDSAPPAGPTGRMEFVRADLCDGGLPALIAESGADTVLHLSLAGRGSGGASAGSRRRARGAHSLLGTMQVLAACQSSAHVRRLVVRSSTSVYGASPAPDAVEGERYVQGLARRRPEISVAVLRLANVIGPSVESPVTRYIDGSFVPRVRGDDPAMPFLHEDDGAEAIRRMAVTDDDGFFDVAAADAIPLSQCARRAGRPDVRLPRPGLRVLCSLARNGRLGEYDQVRQLCCGQPLDISRLERAVGWRPRYTSMQALEAYLSERRDHGSRRRRRQRRREQPAPRGLAA
ncbi:NAD-dependent epimerase/dehydratase family protein [Spiractinospora alimapuensis]|uniref:NAD-dependent epimerase/dehydratase family protein n=1 Tax=Spiractinospora alimapuensis TaxID=2820884 RepID=UPI001F35DBD5|nr:NAD-dependent epimerase/dehydratase family protein [Spiractinospora alimapuensis]QVQ50624.1 NAD-dependent epimerase/dehydratase family protein [Spiractinospora alimapuensis]